LRCTECKKRASAFAVALFCLKPQSDGRYPFGGFFNEIRTNGINARLIAGGTFDFTNILPEGDVFCCFCPIAAKISVWVIGALLFVPLPLL